MAKSQKGKAIAGLVLGILSIPASIFPLFGLPMGVLGIVYSVKGMKQSEGMAVAGLVCSIIGLILTLINSIWGTYLGATGQHALVNKMMK